MILLFACKEGEDSTPQVNDSMEETPIIANTGGIIARLVWKDVNDTDFSGVNNNINFSAPVGVATVRLIVSAEDMNTQQMDFVATANAGIISGIKVGNNRTLTLRGIDSNGVTTYEAMVPNITVSTAQTTNLGTIIMESPVAGLPVDGLVAYYPFNGSSDDESGNNNNGTENGVTLTTDRFGNGNSAYSFDGVDDYITASFTEKPISGTISVWIRHNSPTGLAHLVDGSESCGRFTFSLSESKPYQSMQYNSCVDLDEHSLNSSTTIPENNWSFLTFIWGTSGRQIYINGLLTDSNNYTGTSSSSGNLVFGRKLNPISSYYNGIIDDIRIYNRALSESEIQQLDTLDRTAPTSNGFTINSNADYTDSEAVTLNLDATDDTAVASYYASEINTTPAADDNNWVDVTADVTYSGNVSYALQGGEGENTVYVWFKDAAGNVSSVNSDVIILDTTAPTSTSTLINNDDASTDSININLSLLASDSNGIVSYLASNANAVPAANDAGWVSINSTTNYSATVPHTLESSNGDKTVYIWFKDEAGNISTVDSDTITLDTSSTIPTDGLVAYYPFNGNANDESANSNNGTVNGATLTTDRDGNANSAYSFDGVDDKIDIPHHDSLNLDANFSISVWINASAWGTLGYARVLAKQGTAGDGAGYSLKLNNNVDSAIKSANISIQDNSGVYYTVRGQDNCIDLNNYHHLVATYDGSTMTLYSDTVKVAEEIPNQEVGLNTHPLTIGYYPTRPYSGVIDDIRIYNRALTASEITALYNEVPDTTAPQSPSLTINEGSTTDDANVTLTLSATDTSGVTGYYILETNLTPDINASGWVDVTSDTNYSNNNVAYTIQGGDGDRTIYVWFKDLAGNISIFASDMVTFNTQSWIQATANAGWDARNTHTNVLFDNKMWVLGGRNAGGLKNDVWYSSDGTNWTQATASAPWSARKIHESVVFDEKIWVIGGVTSTEGLTGAKDAWYSSDGVNWTQASASNAWMERAYAASVVFDNKIWVIGGLDASNNYLNDVWYSSDGTNWTQATASAPWAKRGYFEATVFNDKIWITGGQNASGRLNDVWYSSDGVNWTQATSNASWSQRSSLQSASFDNNIWILGGFDTSDTNLNDAWYSSDGINWTESNVSNSWPARRSHTSIIYSNKLWILGGYGGSYYNDVWSLDSDTSTDSTPPGNLSAFINNGDASTDSATVTVNLTAFDQVGVTAYIIKETSSVPLVSDVDWTDITSTDNYSTTVNYTISDITDGTKAVYVWYKDAAGNVTPVISDTIDLMIAPINLSVSINSDAAETTSTAVTLSLSASDDTGVVGYYASNNNTEPAIDDIGWQTFSATANYTADVSHDLESGDGTKTVYVWYKDAAGSLSASDSDTITLDTTGGIIITW